VYVPTNLNGPAFQLKTFDTVLREPIVPEAMGGGPT